MKTEFEFIQNIKEKYSLNKIGDDCAVLPKDDKTDLVLTADMLVEDIDFRLEWTTPEFLGHKTLAVSLSDIAAMGAEPKWAMLSIGVSETLWNNGFVERFYNGWHDLARQVHVELIGGDVSRTPEKLFIDSIAGGEVQKGKAILRSGAKVGDSVFVTGCLGGAAGGLNILESQDLDANSEPSKASRLIGRHNKPMPQLEKAISLMATGSLHSMIDVSDGFISDLQHICSNSQVGARIFAESIPVDFELSNFFDLSTAFELALNGGEDFELIFTAPPEKIYAPKLNEISCVGEITSNVGIIELIRDGKTEILEPKGYRHF